MFTIGEFSKLGRISPRMLRYYDAMGLLRPTRIGENGYRYYEAAQLETLAEIETLKDRKVQRFGAKTLGIVGFGKIGRAVAVRARAFGMKVIAHDPYIGRETAERQGVELVSIDRILEEADVISIHMNLTSENENYFNKEKFDKMKRQPYIINMARGAMINEEDLADALDRQVVSGAGLDVLYSESPELGTSKLINRENVIITPHCGFYSDDAIEACERISVQNITYYMNGEKEKVFKIVNGI